MRVQFLLKSDALRKRQGWDQRSDQGDGTRIIERETENFSLLHPNAVGPRISKIIFGTLREVVKKTNNKETPGVGFAVGSGGRDTYYREGKFL